MAEKGSLIVPRANRGNVIRTAEDVEVIFDVTVSTSWDYKSNVTDRPVESGAVLQDHVKNRPLRVTTQGIITQTPLLAGDDVQPHRDQRAKQALLEARREIRPLTLVTDRVVVDNMMIERLKDDENEPLAHKRLKMTLKRIREAVAQNVEVPADVLAEILKASAGSKTDKGEQSSKDEEDDEETLKEKLSNSSGMKTIFGFFGGGDE